ncbi:scavenger receptor cysteine-rich domain-containing protein DMBT1-like [Saccoglossus kowalevskii]|uniref:Deleted in malignant brain tumors 1 protein-like n=1 Tax=Saccoglossus kowalevskii TaxID=10224 RepID=A0ABM0MGW5_SACKO|nr:PREDICTED: deleted in malignant brain tumors 1 protein-like [Saccoglossus kowalevskii]
MYQLTLWVMVLCLVQSGSSQTTDIDGTPNQDTTPKPMITQDPWATPFYCGRSYNIPSWSYIEITSPFYPNDYPNDARCDWVIYAAYSYRNIYVEFYNFDTESCCDFVSVGNGDTPGVSVVIDRHSGSKLPQSFYSSGRTVWLRFYSDSSVTNSGFRVRMYDQEAFTTKDRQTTDVDFTTPNVWPDRTTERMNTQDPWATAFYCGRSYNIPSWSYIEITSPFYPNDYPNDARCDWVIYAAYSYRNIYVEFYNFDTESCCDYVSVGNGDTPGVSVVIDRHSGSTLPQSFYSSGRTVWMRFYSDGSVTNSGFRVRMYDQEDYDCVDTYHLPQWGSIHIESPNYPGNYPNNCRCQWIVYADAYYRRLYVHFNDFETEAGYDNVSIGDGYIVGDNVRLDQYSGSSNPPAIYSNDDAMWMTFYSDSSVTLRGFQAHFHEIGSYSTYEPVTTDDPKTTDVHTTTEYIEDVVVECGDTWMRIDISRSILGSITDDDLQLIDPSCYGAGNDTHVSFVTDHSDCGTTQTQTTENMIYRNKVINRWEIEDVIRREAEVEIPFQCIYSRTGRAEASFVVNDDQVFLTETGYGNFSFTLDFYPDGSYNEPYSDEEYPIEVSLGQILFVGAAVETNLDDLELFLATCKATPSEDADHSIQYAIIENGCIMDETVQIQPTGNPAEKHFSIQAFEFVDSPGEVIYIHCDMLVCNASDIYSRCEMGCITNARRKRDGEMESLVSQSVSQGPISLTKRQSGVLHAFTDDRSEDSYTGPGLVVLLGVFCIGILLVISAIVYVAGQSTKRAMPLIEEY